MLQAMSFRGVAYGLVDRKFASDGRALAERGIDTDLAAMQLHEGFHQRQAKARATAPRAVRNALAAAEPLGLDVRCDAWPGVGPGKPDSPVGPPHLNADCRILR